MQAPPGTMPAMCSHYEATKNPERYRTAFKVEPPASLGVQDVWPMYLAGFIRRHPHADVGDDAVPAREALVGMFGMVPHWAKDTKGARHTYNARSETVAEKPSFRDAWRRAQHCIIPADAFYEPDWRSGRSVPTRISRADREPMGIAGLWTTWKSSSGESLYSFTMLTINADDHPFMKQFHKPGEEKRMVVVLSEHHYDAWLTADAAHASDPLVQYPAELMQADTAPRAHP